MDTGFTRCILCHCKIMWLPSSASFVCHHAIEGSYWGWVGGRDLLFTIPQAGTQSVCNVPTKNSNNRNVTMKPEEKSNYLYKSSHNRLVSSHVIQPLDLVNLKMMLGISCILICVGQDYFDFAVEPKCYKIYYPYKKSLPSLKCAYGKKILVIIYRGPDLYNKKVIPKQLAWNFYCHYPNWPTTCVADD